MKTVKILMIAEIEVDENAGDPAELAQIKLDAFRDATKPSAEWDIYFYRVRPEDADKHSVISVEG